MPKPRINLRLSHAMYDQLMMAAAAPGVTIGEIVETALGEYFGGTFSSADSEAICSRLDRLEVLNGTIERDLAVTTETIAMFARYWLTATPPLPKHDRDAAHALGAKRFERFKQQVAEAVGSEQITPLEN